MNERADRRQENGTFLFGRDGAMLRKIVDNAAIGMAVCAMDGSLVYTNRAFDRDFCLPGDPGGDISSVFESGDENVRDAIAELLDGSRDAYDGEHRCHGTDGALIWAMVAMSILHSDATGEPMYIIAQLGSVDRRKRAEAALKESESRWHFALESARQGVWDHDSRTGAMFYSPMWRTMRGIPQDEPLDDSQQAWLSRLHPDDRARIQPNVSRQNEGEDGYDILEYRERHRDGHYIWILSRGKPVEWDEAGNVVRTVGTDTDITHLKQIEARLEHAATHDSLTGLANRSAFRKVVEIAASGPGPDCLMFIDLDHFKPVNDALGHAAGDKALIEAARAIAKSVRAADFAARMGGDEFAVLLRGCALADSKRIAEAIQTEIGTIVVDLNGAPHTLGASIGVTAIVPGESTDTGLARADAACYLAKREGRGRIVTKA